MIGKGRALPALIVRFSGLVMASTVAARVAVAQQSKGPGWHSGLGSSQGCTLCHGMHPGPAAQGSDCAVGPRFLLIPAGDRRSTPGGGCAADLLLVQAAPGVSWSSLTCLRCHWTAQVRVRESVATESPPGASAAPALLGDLRDDHPVGTAWGIPRNRSVLGFPPRSSRTAPLGSERGAGTQSPESTAPDCATCHDPHRPGSLIPRPEEERALCNGCHDPATYQLGQHGAAVCSDCHGLHGGSQGSLLKEGGGDQLCRSCHAAVGFDVSLSTPRPALQPARGHLSRQEPGFDDCLSCHGVHR